MLKVMGQRLCVISVIHCEQGMSFCDKGMHHASREQGTAQGHANKALLKVTRTRHCSRSREQEMSFSRLYGQRVCVTKGIRHRGYAS